MANSRQETVPRWAQRLIAAHVAVAGKNVSHSARIQSRRYFVWEELEENDWCGNNCHGEEAVTGNTDLFTEREFDPWAAALGPALDAAGIVWEKTGTTWEPSTKLYHHSWRWEVG